MFDGLNHQLQNLSILTSTKINDLQTTLEKVLSIVEKHQCQPTTSSRYCATCLLPREQSETDIYISRTEKRKQINFLSRDMTSTVVQHRSSLSSCKKDQSVPVEDLGNSPSDIFQSQAMDLYSSTHCIQMKTPEYNSPLWSKAGSQGSGSRCHRPSTQSPSFTLGQQFTLQNEARLTSSFPSHSSVKSCLPMTQKTHAPLQDMSRRKAANLSRTILKSVGNRPSMQQHSTGRQDMCQPIHSRTRSKRKFCSSDSASSEDEVKPKRTRNCTGVRRPCGMSRCMVVEDDAFLSSPMISADSLSQVSSCISVYAACLIMIAAVVIT